MRWSGRGSGVLAAALTALALLVTASPAGAVLDPTDYTIRKRDFLVAGDLPGIGGGYVGCGPGRRVVTGGAFWHHAGEGTDPLLNAYLSSSAPTPDGKGWFAAGINWGDDASLRVIAYCLPASRVGTYTVRTFDIEVPSKSVASHDQRCPKGKRVVTGGALWHQGDLDPDPLVEAYLRSSSLDRDAKGWYFAGLNDGPDLHLMVIALCLPVSALGRFVVRAVEVPAPDGGAGSGGQACGSRKRALGGGALWHQPGETRDATLSAYVRGSFPRRAGRGWSVLGYNSSGQALEMRNIVLCLQA